jgi:hypothetical protein
MAAIALLLSCLSAPAQPLTPRIEQYAAKCKAERQMALVTASKNLRELSKKRDIDRDERKARAERLNVEIANLEDPLKPYHGELIHFFEVKVGDIGWFDAHENGRRNYFRYDIRAFQIVDQKNALIRVSLFPGTAPGLSNSGKLMWLSGMDTSTLENGGDVDLSGIIAVTGNKTYETSDGSNTVLVLEVVDAKKYENLFTRQSESRTWRSTNGHTTEAIFVRYESGRAVLVGLNGKTMKVRLTDLSDEDRKYVSEQIKALAKTK